MRIAIPNATAALAVAVTLVWPAGAAALNDLVINVGCASGESIGRALSRPTVVDRRMVVVVSGTCTENVVIERDDVVLRAHVSGGGVNPADAAKPAILVNGAKRVALEGLSVVGGRHGVQVTGGAAAAIRGSAIRNAVANGVLVDGRASAVVEGSTIENNGRQGVSVEGAGVTMTDSNVRGNGLSGVASLRGGSATLGDTDNAGNVCCGNTIENNTLDGLIVGDSSSANLHGNVVQGNGRRPAALESWSFARARSTFAAATW